MTATQMRENEEAQPLSPSQRIELMKRLKKDLNGFWSLNWERILNELNQLQPSELERDILSKLLIKNINGIMERGSFRELEGVQTLLEYFGIEDLVFNGDWLDTIDAYLKRFSLDFLYRMSPSTYNNRLHDGSIYRKDAYTTKLLREEGMLTEGEDVELLAKELWRVREILVKLHYQKLCGKYHDVKELAGRKIIGVLSSGN